MVHGTCLVTGGAGFIGSNLARALLDGGSVVIVVDDFSTGKPGRLPRSPRLTTVRADLATYGELEALLAGCDYVFHLAARVGNVRSIHDPVGDARTNILGTVRLLAACRGASLKKIVYSSSSAAFGEAVSLPIHEDHPLRPESFYALSKLAAERYALLAARLFGLPVVCLRYFNVYGLPMERSEYAGVISIFMQRLRESKPLTLYGDGSQFRDFIHVSDVVQANLLAASRGEPGSVYNVGTGVHTTILDLARLLADIAGAEPEFDFQPPRTGEVRQSVACIDLARRELGFEPAYSLRRGLAEMWQAMTRSDSPGHETRPS